MEKEYKIRFIKSDDFAHLIKWWKHYDHCEVPTVDLLPNYGMDGYVVEKNGKPIMAAFMYLTNSKGVLLEYIVSDPEYRENDRDSAIELLLKTAEQFVKNIGCKFMFTVTQHDKLIKAHEKLGWKKDPRPSHELIKVI